MFGFLRDPGMAGVDVDDLHRLDIHRQVLARKPILRGVFREFHYLFDRLDRENLSGRGLRVELGAEIAPMRDSFPDVLATDIVPAAELDRVLDAEGMDLGDASVRAFVAQNCFHHLPHPDRFFGELQRVLVPGGGAILLEPFYGPLASFVFPRLFATEGFDKRYPSWSTPVSGPMNGANQALSYIVFVRDRAKFEKLYPELRIVYCRPCTNYLRYLASGGLNFRQIWPGSAAAFLHGIEWLLSPFARWLALHHVIVLKKV